MLPASWLLNPLLAGWLCCTSRLVACKPAFRRNHSNVPAFRPPPIPVSRPPPDAELWDALGHVALKDVVAALPEGLSARVAENGAY